MPSASTTADGPVCCLWSGDRASSTRFAHAGPPSKVTTQEATAEGRDRALPLVRQEGENPRFEGPQSHGTSMEMNCPTIQSTEQPRAAGVRSALLLPVGLANSPRRSMICALGAHEEAMRMTTTIHQRPSALIVAVAVAHIFAATATAQLPDLFTSSLFIECSPHGLHQGQVLRVIWKGINNDTYPIPGGFGPAYGPWEDGIFLTNGSTNILIGTAGFTGVLTHGQYYDQTVDFVIPNHVPDGTYRIFVKIDYVSTNSAGRVIEANEENNEDSGYFGLASADIARLRLHTIAYASNGVATLSWNSVTNCTYEVWGGPDVQKPWTILISNVVATPPVNTATATGQNSINGFFRIRAIR